MFNECVSVYSDVCVKFFTLWDEVEVEAARLRGEVIKFFIQSDQKFEFDRTILMLNTVYYY